MATTNKKLGAKKPAAITLENLYTVPDNTQAIATVFIANQNNTSDDSFRIAVLKSGDTISDADYIAYDADIGHGTFMSVTSFAINAGDKIKVYSHNGDCSFNVFGLETA